MKSALSLGYIIVGYIIIIVYIICSNILYRCFAYYMISLSTVCDAVKTNIIHDVVRCALDAVYLFTPTPSLISKNLKLGGMNKCLGV